jgi:hypothetical protein
MCGPCRAIVMRSLHARQVLAATFHTATYDAVGDGCNG